MPFQHNESLDSQPCLIGRRSMLGLIGTVGAGFLASSASANAYLFGPKVDAPSRASKVALPDLPSEWLANNRSASAYMQFLASQKFKKIDPGQVIEAHAKQRGSVWNELPPNQWWKRMAYTLKVVDYIAVQMDASHVEVISAYRKPAYNARCAGAKSGSWHKANVAADVNFGMRPSKVTRTARELRGRGLFKGGVGGYWNFTHIDTRGVNVNW